MSASRTLARKLDLDLIARIEASGAPEKPRKISRNKKPRKADTYRGARRNARRQARTEALARKRRAQP